MTGDTFTGNNATYGCGLDNDSGVATLYNTIVAGNYVTRFSYDSMPSEISGTVSGSYNLIGDPHSAGGLTIGPSGNILGVADTYPIPLSMIFATDANGVPLLASYGGTTQTVALVPGSPAIDAGSASVPNFPSIDQRGFPIAGAPDIGAFESQGFHLTIAGGDDQATPVGQAFASPLTVTITPINPLEPVNGGTIFFVPPQNTVSPPVLPSAEVSLATIVNGIASVTAAANDVPGSYQVFASVPESNAVEFDLVNETFNTPDLQTAITTAPPGGITLQPSANLPLGVILNTLASLGHELARPRSP